MIHIGHWHVTCVTKIQLFFCISETRGRNKTKVVWYHLGEGLRILTYIMFRLVISLLNTISPKHVTCVTEKIISKNSLIIFNKTIPNDVRYNKKRSLKS